MTRTTDAGWLPECRSATKQQYIRGRGNGDPIIGEFYVKYVSISAALCFGSNDDVGSLSTQVR